VPEVLSPVPYRARSFAGVWGAFWPDEN